MTLYQVNGTVDGRQAQTLIEADSAESAENKLIEDYVGDWTDYDITEA